MSEDKLDKALEKETEEIAELCIDCEQEQQLQSTFINNTSPRNHKEFLEFRNFKINEKNEKSERELRKENAKSALIFSSAWAIFIAVIIILHGFGKSFNFFSLTQTEFLFIIGTLTTSIFTFYTLVLKYLFYRKPDRNTPPTNNNIL